MGGALGLGGSLGGGPKYLFGGPGAEIPIKLWFTGIQKFSGKDKTHKHKQICGIVPGLGGCQTFVYVFFSGHSLWGRKKHINKIPPRQSRGNFVYLSRARKP